MAQQKSTSILTIEKSVLESRIYGQKQRAFKLWSMKANGQIKRKLKYING